MQTDFYVSTFLMSRRIGGGVHEYEEIAKRDKASLDIFCLRGRSPDLVF